MQERFAALIRPRQEVIIRAWVDHLYRERRVRLTELLSYEQLVDYVPELLEELGRVLDLEATESEIMEATLRLRAHAQIRFRQGALIDEVARELITFRQVFDDFLWREGIGAIDGDLWKLRDALRRTDWFVDELIVQAVVIYAAALRPPVETRASVWPPPRRRRTDFPESDR